MGKVGAWAHGTLVVVALLVANAALVGSAAADPPPPPTEELHRLIDSVIDRIALYGDEAAGRADRPRS